MSAADDVVILYGDRAASDLVQLHRILGRNRPAVLVLSRLLDVEDVQRCFDNGATSYLVIDELPEFCVVEAVVRTAEGQSSLSPSVLMVLMDRVRRPNFTPPPVARESGDAQISDLSPREFQIMELLVAGHTISEIADYLRLTNKTVRNNLSSIYAKLDVRRQSEAILLWLGHQRKPGEPARYNEPRFVPRLSPMHQYFRSAV